MLNTLHGTSQHNARITQPAVAAGDRSSGCAPRLTLSLIFALSRKNGCNPSFFSQIFVDFRANARKSTKINEKKTVAHTLTICHAPSLASGVNTLNHSDSEIEYYSLQTSREMRADRNWVQCAPWCTLNSMTVIIAKHHVLCFHS